MRAISSNFVDEHVVEQEDGPFDRCELLEQHHERHRERLVQQQAIGAVGLCLREHRLRQSRAGVGLAPGSRRVQMIVALTPDDRRQECSWRCDLHVATALPQVSHDVTGAWHREDSR